MVFVGQNEESGKVRSPTIRKVDLKAYENSIIKTWHDNADC